MNTQQRLNGGVKALIRLLYVVKLLLPIMAAVRRWRRSKMIKNRIDQWEGAESRIASVRLDKLV